MPNKKENVTSISVNGVPDEVITNLKRIIIDTSNEMGFPPVSVSTYIRFLIIKHVAKYEKKENGHGHVR